MEYKPKFVRATDVELEMSDIDASFESRMLVTNQTTESTLVCI